MVSLDLGRIAHLGNREASADVIGHEFWNFYAILKMEYIEGATQGKSFRMLPLFLGGSGGDNPASDNFSRRNHCYPSLSKIVNWYFKSFGFLSGPTPHCLHALQPRRALREALGDINRFPRVRLDVRTCIGKARLQLLARPLA